MVIRVDKRIDPSLLSKERTTMPPYLHDYYIEYMYLTSRRAGRDKNTCISLFGTGGNGKQGGRRHGRRSMPCVMPVSRLGLAYAGLDKGMGIMEWAWP
jgi:hypothetical protein